MNVEVARECFEAWKDVMAAISGTANAVFHADTLGLHTLLRFVDLERANGSDGVDANEIRWRTVASRAS